MSEHMGKHMKYIHFITEYETINVMYFYNPWEMASTMKLFSKLISFIKLNKKIKYDMSIEYENYLINPWIIRY